MYTYYIIVIFLYLLGVLLYQKKYNIIYIIFSFIVLLLISGLRGYTVGGDLEYYLPLFSEISNQTFEQLINSYDKYGFLFKFYFWIFSFINKNPTYFLICESALILFIALYFIYKSSDNLALSVFLYITLGYYTNSFNSIRSSFALVLAALGVLYIMYNKRIIAFIIFLIAFEIHKTILPVFILLFFKNYKLSLFKIITCIIVSYLLSTIIGISGFAPLILLYNEGYSKAIEFSGQGYSLLIMYIVITLISYLCIKDSKSNKNNLLLFLLLMATCLQTLAPVFSFATRISYFFSFYMIILIPNIIREKFKGINYKIVLLSLVVVSLVYFKITVMTPTTEYNSNSQHTLPYYFFWENNFK